MQERLQFLADVARNVNNLQEKNERIIPDPAVRLDFEAGYALLRAARLHGCDELPFDVSNRAYPVFIQCGLENISAKLVKDEKPLSSRELSLIYATAIDILGINHPAGKVSEAEKRLRDFNEARKLSLHKRDDDYHVEAAERILGLRK